jgi:ornithine cyclodeaminase/alanine dehydrogenase-like protein (mu-crystallin family)
MIPYFTSEQIQYALPFDSLITALRAAFKETMHVPPRHVHPLSAADASVLLLMPVWQPEQHLGVKLVTVAPANRERGLSTVQAIFILMDCKTGVPLALFDGEELTLRRTAAASAVASSLLSRPDSKHLLIVGAGQLAPYMALAHCAVRPIETITIWARSPEKAQQTLEKIAAHTATQSYHLQITTDLALACQQADIISCATTSKEPLIAARNLKAGTHVDLVGGFRPDMREADDALMAAAALFVDTYAGACNEAGDIIQPQQAGLITSASVLAELAELVHGKHAGRQHAEEITIFKSVGTALEDLCAANLVWQRLGQAASTLKS